LRSGEAEAASLQAQRCRMHHNAPCPIIPFPFPLPGHFVLPMVLLSIGLLLATSTSFHRPGAAGSPGCISSREA
jgi:hypothetical protein